MNIHHKSRNKFFFIFILTGLLNWTYNAEARAPKRQTIPEVSGYKLIWNDEFDGPTLDKNKWNYEVHGGPEGNNELQYYTDSPKNSYMQDGNFVIQAIKEPYEGKEYTSARITTAGKFDFKYGRVDIRAILPTGRGFWPALWLLPSQNVYGAWPLSGEIDIMELIGHQPTMVYGSLNYGDPAPNNKYLSVPYTLPQGAFNENYHVFSIVWEPNLIQWFVDGNLYSTKTPNDLGNCASGPCPWRFDQNFFIIFNVAVGGNWPGNPDPSTVFPQTMKVDYVRVYQKQN